jgi:hypothetical protein
MPDSMLPLCWGQARELATAICLAPEEIHEYKGMKHIKKQALGYLQRICAAQGEQLTEKAQSLLASL